MKGLNGIGPLHYPKNTKLWWGLSTMYSLSGYHQSEGRVRTERNSDKNFHFCGVWDSSVAPNNIR